MASLLDMFLADWAGRPQLETAYSTEVIRSNAGSSESRRARAARPARTITVTWTPTTRGELSRLLAMLANATGQEIVIPLAQDQAIITANSSGTTIYANPSSRRFSAGNLVVVHGADDTANAQVRVIDSFGGSSIVTTAALTGTVTAGGYAYPGVACRLLLEPERVALVTGTVGQVQAVFEEVQGSQALAPFVALGSTAGWATAADPSGLGTYPILATEPEWTERPEIGFVRPGHSVGWGLDKGVYALGTRPRALVSATVAGTTRAESIELLSLFDSRAGRLLPFWLISPVEQWEVVGKSSTSIEITAEGDYSDQTLYNAVGLVLADGTRIVRPISSRVDSGSTWVLGWTTAASFDLEDIVRAAPAYFVRFSEDAIREEWITENIGRVGLSVIEVHDEATVAISSIAERNAACECLTPLNLGPIGWWKADGDVTVDGSLDVTQWGDETGNGNDLTSLDSSKRPSLVNNYQNGLPVVSFDGVDEGIHVGGVSPPLTGLSTPFPIAWVGLVKITDATNGSWVTYWDSGTYVGSRSIFLPAISGAFATNSADLGGGSSATSTVLADSNWHMIYGAVVSGSERTISVDGEAEVSAGGVRTTLSPDYFTLGGMVGYPTVGPSAYYDPAEMVAAEVLAFDRELTADDLAYLKEYFEQRWDLTL